MVGGMCTCVCVYMCVHVCVCMCVCTCVEKQTALISTTRAKVQEMFSGFLKHIWIVNFYLF